MLFRSSFTIRSDSGKYIHHNPVVAILNDLFGIQARGGCSCAGPYGHRLLGIELDRSMEFQREIGRGCEGIKPGWVRVNFNYFISEAVADYIIEAVQLVADLGERLVPMYRFHARTGLWTHRSGPIEPPLRLSQVTYSTDGTLTYPHHADRLDEGALAVHLAEGRALLELLPAVSGDHAADGQEDDDLGADFESLRWFMLPSESLVR